MCLILASSSSRRLDLLRQIGIEPDAVEHAQIDEAQRPGERPGDMAVRLADAKAAKIAARRPGAAILAADTVVACGRRVLAKAADADQARASLRILSGRRHRVHTGVCVVMPEGACRRRLVTTIVRFKRLTDCEIDAYVAAGEWRDKAGAYAIQGRAGAFAIAINGSYSNVVGLPLYETLALLTGCSVLDTPRCRSGAAP